ncbi:MAG: hypothetical protein HY233_02020 [Acidobacteriales bacterium]|nr:hypothetical protein [Candidatus Koribacter versatilis]MBI3644733.1 hypothetical protein [Terriglobales bacterium]
MDLNDVAERLADLRQEIRALQDLNSQYQDRESHTQIDESAQEQRRLRLEQIKDELADMMKRPARH